MKRPQREFYFSIKDGELFFPGVEWYLGAWAKIRMNLLSFGKF